VRNAGWVFDSCQLKAARPRRFQRSNKVCHVVRSLMYANEGVRGGKECTSIQKRRKKKQQSDKNIVRFTRVHQIPAPVLHLKTGVSGVKSTG